MDAAVAIMENALHGVLALNGDGGYTYAVPVNHVFTDNKIFFHGAVEGHKIDALKNNDKVSFCVIEKGDVIAEKFDTNYRSAIAFGRIRLLETDKERYDALEALVLRFSPGYHEAGKEEIKKAWARTAVFEIEVEHLTAKEGR